MSDETQSGAAGHVFVLHGDLTQLACDAWLLPTDAECQVLPHWLAVAEEHAGEPPHIESTELGDEGAGRVAPVSSWPAGLPTPFLVNVGHGGKPTAWFVEGALEFVRKAAPWARVHDHRFVDRSCPLLAVPIVGTGLGGKRERADEVLASLLPALRDEAQRQRVDVAVVAWDAADYGAAQAARRRLGRSEGEAHGWPALDGELLQEAERLAALAAAGRLVLFLGAGVSAGAGLPHWGALLSELAAQAELSERERGELERLDHLDRAAALSQLGGAGAIGAATAKIIDAHRCYAPAHALLAALPVTEVVTQNYDELFERASRAAGRELSVLPYEPTREQRRWLLKMHGCVTQPADIVLSRQHYIRYDQRRAALAGIVQALLITKHMLFVGFSLSDDNFHRVADTVRQALGDAAGEGFGTSIALLHNSLQQKLWPDLNWVALHDDEPPAEGEAVNERLLDAARRFEILLDYIAHRTAGSHHLFEERFAGVLSPEEQALRDVLELLRQAGDAARQAPGWEAVERLLERFGG